MRKAFSLAAALVSFGLAASAIAEDNPLANRPQDVPPALHFLQSQGVKLTYLGEEGGVRGYLGENPSGKMQTFYLTPDGAHVIAGVLFRSGGLNVTGLQIGEMQKRFEDARQQLGGTISGGAPEARSATIDPATAPTTPGPGTPAPATQPHAAPAPQSPAKTWEAVPAPAPAATAPVAAAPAAEAPKAEARKVSADAYLSKIPKDKFLTEVADVAWFRVGEEEAPTVYMIADPQCPFCHAAWAKLRPMVVARKLAVNVILINGLQGSEPLAISILSRPEPGRAWYLGEGSEKGVVVAPPPAADTAEYKAARSYLDINGRFALSMGLTGTPFLAYVGKDGKLYSAEGPKDLEAFLAAL